MTNNKKTLGFALSGSGNRTSFYIGFFEVLEENNIKIDYICACSGGALVASAYACGTLQDLKKKVLSMTSGDLIKLLTKKRGVGGLYSLDDAEQLISEVVTKNKNFDEVKPIMSFVAADIEKGELFDLCMGDIARAVRISCTTPALFEPVKWGNRSLVDGGLLSMVPLNSLKKFSPDISICVDMAYTRHIFPSTQISFKKLFNFIKNILFIDELKSLYEKLAADEYENKSNTNPNFFAVWGRSLDLAIKANKSYKKEIEPDLLIKPRSKELNKTDLRNSSMERYYKVGRRVALENLQKINKLIAE